ncbi:guanine nucleotide-binding protein beta SU like protein (nucleomorph) [Cryptomonas paramecium]|uniref:Guanine nucleotide-binding protein beta SU like protein n=1 Tax=Cryptomonas paramaecium TaxID=2898 RepID=F2HHU4_9CRYP|nr:guanine nucleotide-binding protein beta SU like protein [Cryptomonas paramecium]AEA38890.1 guanine nucleotide-binding protein beta SU like protein [Cryptomonas paramecium]|mmetsp:Transcript_88799/g.236390  ORF Transcript_88799/g.236390 Transcript_88799/m.236390 type:complete len:772 (-) Transcript_88799:150-2465(-)
MNCIYYGNCYSGGKAYFFHNKKKIVFLDKNKIVLVNFKIGFFRNFVFYTRSTISSFDVDKTENFMLVTDSTKLVSIFNLKTFKVVCKMVCRNKIENIKISPFLKYFTTVNFEKIEIWKFSLFRKNSSCIFQLYQRYNLHYSYIIDVEWSDDGNYLLSFSMDKTIKIFSFQGRKIYEMNVNIYAKKIIFAKFHLNSKKILILNENGLLSERTSVYDLNKNAQIFSKPSNDTLMQIFPFLTEKVKVINGWFNSFSNAIILIFSNGQLTWTQIFMSNYNQNNNIAQILAKKKVVTEKLFKIDPFELFYITGCLNENLILICKLKKKEILLYNWFKKKFLIKYRNLFKKFTFILLSPNNNLACLCDSHGNVAIWSLISGFCVAEFYSHIDRVNRAVFLKKFSRLLFTSSIDGTIKMYDLKKCTILKSFDSLSSTKHFDALGIDNSGSFVASACEKTFCIFIWTVKNGLIVDIMKKHRTFINDLYFTHINLNIVTATCNELAIWFIDNRIYNKKTSFCEIFQSHTKIIAICQHPHRDEIAVLFLCGSISFFDVKKGFKVYRTVINTSKIIKTKNETLNTRPAPSISYFLNGKFFFIKTSKLKIFRLYNFRLFFLFCLKMNLFNKKNFQISEKKIFSISTEKKICLVLNEQEFFLLTIDVFDKKIKCCLKKNISNKKNSKNKNWNRFFRWICDLKLNKKQTRLDVNMLFFGILNERSLQLVLASKAFFSKYSLNQLNHFKQKCIFLEYISSYKKFLSKRCKFKNIPSFSSVKLNQFF